MSVKHALLALLEEGPRYGYELKSGFESRTGATWPLNVGQVYTTLNRLERDGLVERDGDNANGQALYRRTAAGARETSDWWSAPVDREVPARDELAIKIALAVGTPGVDARDVLQRQRTATVRALQAHTRKKNAVSDDTAVGLLLDALIFAAEAEVAWLNHCEARLTRARNGAR
ncbi:MAG: PadR family transcriptional regulator [Actinobacteria bacterium]|nr:PadR family transcriptional regulator [Actinomycetota bacterium]MCA1721729.1 PadR family transcriptional regulator [Actinomycetota bacterium]